MLKLHAWHQRNALKLSKLLGFDHAFQLEAAFRRIKTHGNVSFNRRPQMQGGPTDIETTAEERNW